MHWLGSALFVWAARRRGARWRRQRRARRVDRFTSRSGCGDSAGLSAGPFCLWVSGVRKKRSDKPKRTAPPVQEAFSFATATGLEPQEELPEPPAARPLDILPDGCSGQPNLAAGPSPAPELNVRINQAASEAYDPILLSRSSSRNLTQQVTTREQDAATSPKLTLGTWRQLLPILRGLKRAAEAEAASKRSDREQGSAGDGEPHGGLPCSPRP